jgi:hypothetical protein
MSVIGRIEHVNIQGDTIRVDIEQTGYAGPITEYTATGDFARLEWDNLNQANPFSTPVQSSRLTVAVYDMSALYEQIQAAPEGTYAARMYLNGALQWSGVILPDLCSRSEANFPNAFTLFARDLTGIGAVPFPLELSRRSIINVLSQALRATGFDLPIVTYTSWIEANNTPGIDFLAQNYIDTSALRVYDADNGDQPISMSDVLTFIARNFKVFISQRRGAWQIEQWSFNSTTRVQNLYNPFGVLQSDFGFDIGVPANTDTLRVVRGSVVQSAPGYKSVTTTFNHRTKISGIAIPQILGVVGQSVFTQPYVGTAASITFSGTVRIQSETEAQTLPPYIGITIQVGNFYFDANTNEWTTQLSGVRITPESTGSVRRGEGPGDEFRGDFAINTPRLPVFVVGTTLTITLFQYGGSVTEFRAMDYSLNEQNAEENSESISYVRTQVNDFSVTYNDGVTLFGDGPTAYSASAVRWSQMGAIDLTRQWSRIGETGVQRGLHEQLTDEVMSFHRRSRRLMQTRLLGLFPSGSALVYDGIIWQFIGGSYNAGSGQWDAVFLENGFATDNADTFATNLIAPGNTITPGIYTAIAQSRNDVLEAQGILARLELPISGVVSQVFLTQNIDYIAGQFLRVVNPFTAGSVQLRISATGTGAIVPVNLVDISADIYPVGSYVYFSVETISTGIVVAQNAIRLFNESTQIGQLEAGVSGSVENILVRLNTRIRPGQDLEIIGRDGVYRFESAVVAGPGVVSVDIRDLDGVGRVIFADAGSPVLTDPAFVGAYIQIDPADIVLEASNSIVLKINSGGEVVSSLGLFADPDIGGIIAIRADQVLINGVVFTVGTDPITNPGDIASVNYSAGALGWKIGGDGDAEFNNVTVRGSIDASNITGSVSIITGGAITGGASNLTYVIDDNGIDIQDFVTSSDNGGITIDSRTIDLANTVGTDQWTLSVRADEIFMQSPSATFGQTKINTGEIVLFDTSDDGLNIRIDVNGVETVRSLIVGGDADISGDTEISGDLYVGGRVFLDKQTTIDTATDFPYTVDADDFYIRIEDGGTIGGTITLPTATGSGRVLVIKDTTGSAGSVSFTVQRSGSDTIDGATSTSINTNFQTIRLIDAVSGKWELI